MPTVLLQNSFFQAGLAFFAGFLSFLAFIIASFILWRALKDDYDQEDIISFTILFALFSFLGGRFFYLLTHFNDFNFNISKWIFYLRFPGVSLVGAFLVGSVFTYYWTKKRKWNFWILTDGLVTALLPAILVGTIAVFLKGWELVLLGRFVWLLLVLLIFIFVLKNFRKFLWYKSGKPGFIACSLVGLYFLGLAALDFLFKRGVYLEIITALITAIFSLVFLYRRSEREINKDLRLIYQSSLGKLKNKIK